MLVSLKILENSKIIVFKDGVLTKIEETLKQFQIISVIH